MWIGIFIGIFTHRAEIALEHYGDNMMRIKYTL